MDILKDISLQDCPICGGAGLLEEEQGWCFYVSCLDCGAHSVEVAYRKSEDREDAFIDRLLAKPPNTETQQNENPTDGRIAKSRQSVPTSVTKEGIARGDAEPRPSVRQELKQIREDQAQTASKSSRKKNPRAPQHQNHNHSRKRHKKTKER